MKAVGAAAAGGGLLYVIYLAGPAAVAYVEYVATYYTASATAGTAAGLFTGGVAAGAGTTGVLTTLGEIQEIISGKNYTKTAFRDLVKRINPKVSKKKTDELYKKYKESPWAVAVLLVQMAAEAENLGVTGSGEKVESGSLTERSFKNKSLLESHYEKHGREIANVLGENNYSIDKYLDDTNFIINNGIYVPELNGYVKFMSGKKYGFVGIDCITGDITTFHIKNVLELIKKAPSLRLERQVEANVY